MSKFHIYTSKRKSLHGLAIINKSIYVLFCLIFPVLALAGPVATKLGYGDDVILTTLILWLIAIVGLIIFARTINKNIIRHGEIILTTSGITKSISGITEQFSYYDIKEIKIRKHIRNIFYAPNNDGSKTYLVTVTTIDNRTEIFVTSSQSYNSPDINLKDFFKKLEKHTGRKIHLT